MKKQKRNLIRQEDVDHFSPVLPVVVNLRNEGLQERHWEQIHELIGFEIKGRPEITLGELIDKKVRYCHFVAPCSRSHDKKGLTECTIHLRKNHL